MMTGGRILQEKAKYPKSMLEWLEEYRIPSWGREVGGMRRLEGSRELHGDRVFPSMAFSQ
jgi:hypothetical protein